MSSLTLLGDTSGSVILQAPAVAGSGTVTLPTTGGTIRTTTTPGTVLQVLQTVMDDNYLYSTNSPIDISGLAATITPTTANSKILISCVLHYGQGDSSDGQDYIIRLRIKRNGTLLSYTQDSNRTSGDYAVYKNGNTLNMDVAHFQRLDSPNTTLALTYQIQLSTGVWNLNPVGINRPSRFDDADYAVSRARSTITLMEIAG
jgi:hypothetical protein